MADTDASTRIVSFTAMEQGTPEELQAVMTQATAFLDAQLFDNVVNLLEAMRGPTLGYQVDRYEHSLQTATRAWRDGAGSDMVVGALLHDVGDSLAPANHGELAAAIVEPYIDDEATWVVRHHGVFQGYHYWHKLGGDRNARERYRASAHFVAAERFCAAWDQVSFDPAYDTLPLDFFVPTLREVFSRPPRLERFGEDLPADAAG